MTKKYMRQIFSFALAGSICFSNMTAPVCALSNTNVSMISEQTAATSVNVIDGYIYATLDMPYADFYYGELKKLTASTEQTTADFTIADPVADYRKEGQYDAVSSATAKRSRLYDATYYEETTITAATDDKDATYGTDIIGVKQVPIRISETLYKDIKAKVTSNTACSNKLKEIYENLTYSDVAFDEYKTLLADGTFTKMVSKVAAKNDTIKADTILSNSYWGTHEINISGLDEYFEQAELDYNSVLGVVLEDNEGNSYGLKHLENIWINADELAFATKAFTEYRGNAVNYLPYAALEGRSIKKITYLLKDAADIEIETDLLVKKTLSDSDGITAPETITYNKDGFTQKFTIKVPEGTNYTLTEISGLDQSDYTYDNKTATVTFKDSAKPGSYTAVFTDSNYQDVEVRFLIDSGLTADNFVIQNNTISLVNTSLTYADYKARIGGLKIDEKSYCACKIKSSKVFGDDGVINFEAGLKSSDGTVTKWFANGADGDYTVKITATGYPVIETTIGKSNIVAQEPSDSADTATTTQAAATTQTTPATNAAATTQAAPATNAAATTQAAPATNASATTQATATTSAPATTQAATTSAPATTQAATTKAANSISKPKKPSISSLKKKKRNIHVSWKKVKNVTGYQIRYATTASMKSAKTVKASSKTTSKWL